MNTVFLKIKRLFKQLRGLLPSALPTGATAYLDWADDIADTYDLPTKDADSIRYTLATIIMHLGQVSAYKSKYYFVLVIRSSAAKQVAGQAFCDIKEKQRAAQAAATLAEATAVAVAPDASQLKRV